MSYAEVLTLVSALSPEERLRLAEFAIASVREAGGSLQARPTSEVGLNGRVPMSYKDWRANLGDDWFTDEEWEAAFGNLRSKEMGRPSPFEEDEDEPT